MADIFEIAGRIHSTSQEHVISPADEILDTSQNKKQHLINSDVARHESEINSPTNGLNKRVADIEALGQIGDTPVETNASNIINNTSLNGKIPSASAVNGVYNAVVANAGYYTCNSEASTAAKVVEASGYILTVGGCIKIKMTNDNTVDDATININSTGAKALYYDGERASANNSWEAGETVEMYYDGTNFYANNVAGGSGSGDGAFDVSAKYPTSGVEGGNTYTLEGALAVLNANLSARKKKGGMSIKFIQHSDNKYVQYRLMAASWSINTDDWAIADESVYVENSEFIYVKTDAENKILWAIRINGDIFYGAGVPSQVVNYINEKIAELSLDEYEDIVAFLNDLEKGDKTLQTLLDEKVDKKEGKSLIDAEYANGVHYIENPEFVEVKLDSENKIIWAIKKDGGIYYGAGVPQQVIDYVDDRIKELSLDEYEDIVKFLNGLEEEDKTLQQLLDEKANTIDVAAALENKVTVVLGKQLSTNDFTNEEKEIVDRQSFVDNPEYLEVVNDNNGRATEATRAKDGKKVLFGGLIIQETDLSMTDNPEFIDVAKDSNERIVEATRKDGTKYISKLESPTIDKINQRIDNVEDSLLNNDFIKRVSAQLENASVLGWTPQQVWNTPDYYPVDNITPLVFLHISDTHGGLTRKEQIENAVTCLNVLSTGEPNRGLCAKFLFHTGDIKHAEAQDNFTYFSDAVEAANMPVFLTIGNHDVGNYSLLVSHTMDNSQIYNQMIAPFIERWNLKTDGGGNPHQDGKNYYFTDFTAEKVRLISLYEYDTDYELDPNDNTKIKYARGNRSFSQVQLDWFANSLLTTPVGYGVIIAKHQIENATGITDNPFNSYYWRGTNTTVQSYVSTNMIADIVQAFIDGDSISQSYSQTGGIVTTLVADYDFSSKNNNVEFICYCSGHNHCDRISFLKDYPKQLELNVGCDNVHYTWGSDMNQRKDALSNDIINAYCIDRNKGVVNVVRIGANISNQMQRRDFCSINYRVG